MENGALGYMGGVLTSRDGQVALTADQGVFDRLQKLTLEVWPREEEEKRMKIYGVKLSTKETYSSNFVVISPQTELTAPGKKFQVRMQTDPGAENVNIYLLSSDSGFSSWSKVESDIGKDGFARFIASRGGVYVTKSDSYTVLIMKWLKDANLIKRSTRDKV